MFKLSWPSHTSRTEESMAGILQSLMSGRLTAWAIYEKDKFLALTTTVQVSDTISGTKNLMIYTLASVKAVHPALFLRVYNVLRDYAKREGCKFLIARSDNPAVVKIAERIGGNTSVRLIYLEI